MAFRYNVNLIKEQAAQAYRQRAMLQLVTVSLLLFAILLVVTYGVFLWRENPVARFNQDVRLFNDQLARSKVSLPEMEALRLKAKEEQARLTAINGLVQSSLSWPRVLKSLEGCCDTARVKIRRLEGKGTAQAPALYMEGEYQADLGQVPNAASAVHKFLLTVNDDPAFGQPNLLAINKPNNVDLGPHTFEVYIPIKMSAMPSPAPIPAVKRDGAAPQPDGGKS